VSIEHYIDSADYKSLFGESGFTHQAGVPYAEPAQDN